MKKIELTQSPIDARLEAFGRALSLHWLRFVALAVTAILTGYAGFSYTQNLIFSLALVALAEGASLFWAGRVEDAGNRVQMVAAVVGTVIAWSSIAITDLASVTIIAHGAELFTIFQQIPTISQEVAVFVLPVLAVLQGTLGTAHYFFSEEARLNREVNKTLRAATHEISEANAQAQVNIAKAHAARYKARAAAEAGSIGERLGDRSWQDHAARFAPRTEEQRAEIQEAAAEAIPFGNNGRGKA